MLCVTELIIFLQTGNLYWKFKDIRYGATYQVYVQSMPGYNNGADKNEFSREITILGNCIQ